MKIVLQRVQYAKVTVAPDYESSIGHGLLLLLGIEAADNHEDVDWLCRKIAQMRIFGDAEGLMNLSVQDIKGELMVISQFTLHASTKKGNRPSFIAAARPEQAIPLYELFCEKLAEISTLPVAKGVFGGDMKVTLLNDGPVTILLDSKNKQ